MRFPRLAFLLAFLFAAVAALTAQVTTSMPTSGQPVPSLAQLDTIMQQYMTQYGSPGGNLSVSVDGRLVFARGYGYANTTTGEFVQPDSRMRLASNSKIITAVGILKLIEQGKLTLNTTPFTSILAGLTPPPGTTEDPRILTITISELLQHTAGYDDGAGYPFDPVNDYPTNRAAAANAGLTGQACTPAALISYELGVALQHNPGATYAYSNLGYLTLGYIIEKVTGVPYATWIEQNIFPTAMMTQTLPAGNLMADKLPYEVAYYGQEGSGPSMVPPIGVTVPYEYGGYDLQLELANGGWTSTPMDLLRLWDTLNGQYSYNILQNGQTTRVGDVPPLGQGYYYTFYGSLPGTNSLVHLNTSTQVVGRVVYSAIFNTRSGSNLEEPESDADNAIQAYVQTVKAWPTGDLFPTYATAGTACAFTLAATTGTAPMAGNTGSVAVTDANDCAFSAVSNATWLHVTAGSFLNATGTVAYSTDANTGSSRTGTITIAGQTLTVTQAGTTTQTALSLSGTGSVTGTTETINLTATLAPYMVSGNTSDGETISFYKAGTAIGTGKLAGGVATLTTTIQNPQPGDYYYATYLGDTYLSPNTSAFLTITPTSTSATVSPSTLTFPSTPTGLTSAAMTSTFTNTGTTVLSLGLLSVSGPFRQTNTCGGSVAAGATCTFSVTYNPTVVGPATGNVDISDQAGDQIITLSGTATAAAPVVSLNPSTLTFPSTTINTSSAAQLVTVTNTGNAPLTITSIPTNTTGGQFQETNNCVGQPIAVNASCTISVTFTPSAVGPVSASFVLTDNASPTQQTLTLMGTGVAGPAPIATLTPTALTFSNTQVGTTSAAQAATLTNTGTAALTPTAITASAGFAQTNNCPASLAVNASCMISITSSPTAVGPYTGTVTIASNTAATTVMLSGAGSAYPVPTAILTAAPTTLTYGQSTMLTASATNVPTAGNYTWSILDGATVIATSPSSATFVYTVPMPTGGTHNYSAVLTSTANTTTYPTATSPAATVTVAKATTASTFNMPAAITYGTPLGATQLAATSTTPGAFTYTPPTGTILSAGNQALSATLTPTDATDYTGSTAATSILVNKAPLTDTAASATRPYGAANPTFTGTLTGVVNADPITAAYTSSATAIAPAGSTAPITATLNDPNNRLANYIVNLIPATLTITQANTVATLTGPASTPAGAAAILTVTITSTTTGTPTGMVTVSSASGTVGTANLSNGTTTITFTPPTGATALTLTYLGDGNFKASTGALTVTTGVPDFSVTATPTTQSVTAGSSASYTLVNAGVNGFNQTIFYSCTGLPANSTCAFSPAIVATGQPSQLTITTASGVVALNHPTSLGTRSVEQVAGTFLAFLLGLPLLRRRNPALRRSLLSLFLLLGLTAALMGCGSTNNFFNNTLNTPKGTYTITVDEATTGTTSHTTALTLTVQ